jgi:hypothetical protein
VDASNTGFVSSLKQGIGDYDFKTYVQNDRVIKNIHDSRLRQYCSNVIVLPVHFGTIHGEMLFHLNTLLSERKLRIHPSFTKLITALNIATQVGLTFATIVPLASATWNAIVVDASLS